MSTNLKRLYSIEEYFEIEKSSDSKHEYVFGEIFLMPGASPNRNRIAGAISSQLDQQFVNGTCEVFINGLRNRTHQQIYKYPDVVVACEPRFQNIRGLESLTNPLLIVEVLSRSTESFDREGKFQEYQQIDSLRYYLLVAQNEIFATLLARQENNSWETQNFGSLDDLIELPAISASLSLRRTYLRVQFDKA